MGKKEEVAVKKSNARYKTTRSSKRNEKKNNEIVEEQ